MGRHGSHVPVGSTAFLIFLFIVSVTGSGGSPSSGLCTVQGGAYATIQSAYDAAANGDTIQCQAALFNEDLAVNRDITVTLAGGYDAGFTSNAGRKTTLKGMINISAGKITVSNFILEK